jgi:hypothetical protein
MPPIHGKEGEPKPATWKPFVTLARGIGFLAGLVATRSACFPDTDFSVNYAPEFSRGSSNVSVFGVFGDGQMNPRAWDYLRRRLSPPFNDDGCVAAYSDDLITATPALSSAVDQSARTNGVTDDLLDQFAPAAKGDTIMLITVAGRPPQAIDQPLPDSQAQSSRASAASRRGAAANGDPMHKKKVDTDKNAFEITASFFSVRLHRSVGLVDMTYSGPNTDEAVKKFAEKLRAEMPSAACSGWNRDIHVDEKRILDIVEH